MALQFLEEPVFELALAVRHRAYAGAGRDHPRAYRTTAEVNTSSRKYRLRSRGVRRSTFRPPSRAEGSFSMRARPKNPGTCPSSNSTSTSTSLSGREYSRRTEPKGELRDMVSSAELREFVFGERSIVHTKDFTLLASGSYYTRYTASPQRTYAALACLLRIVSVSREAMHVAHRGRQRLVNLPPIPLLFLTRPPVRSCRPCRPAPVAPCRAAPRATRRTR